jgi:hypothetical protein
MILVKRLIMTLLSVGIRIEDVKFLPFKIYAFDSYSIEAFLYKIVMHSAKTINILV